ncbi:MAG TPA: hypothetical protein V6D23_04760 [Candidatus Obscuribacterales bacterium]
MLQLARADENKQMRTPDGPVTGPLKARSSGPLPEQQPGKLAKLLQSFSRK